MIFWIDAQLSPNLAPWLAIEFDVVAQSVRDIGLRDAEDEEIFAAARIAGAVVMTKDEDFVKLLSRYGTPPQILWITCGNTSNARLRAIFTSAMRDAISLLQDGEPLVEISDAAKY